MADRYYILAIISTIVWLAGFVFFDAGPLIHIFFVIAFIMILGRSIKDEM